MIRSKQVTSDFCFALSLNFHPLITCQQLSSSTPSSRACLASLFSNCSSCCLVPWSSLSLRNLWGREGAVFHGSSLLVSPTARHRCVCPRSLSSFSEGNLSVAFARTLARSSPCPRPSGHRSRGLCASWPVSALGVCVFCSCGARCLKFVPLPTSCRQDCPWFRSCRITAAFLLRDTGGLFFQSLCDFLAQDSECALAPCRACPFCTWKLWFALYFLCC